MAAEKLLAILADQSNGASVAHHAVLCAPTVWPPVAASS
jgi:hypothetical protein